MSTTVTGPPARPGPGTQAPVVEEEAALGPAPGPTTDQGAAVVRLSGTWRSAALVVLAACVVVGIGLRFATTSALWLDEALTVDIARLPLSELHGALMRDGAPPLYYVLLHFWTGAFGTSDLAVRSLSGVLSVAALPLGYLAGRRHGGPTVGAATLLLLATSPFAVYYGTEARMYALVMVLTAAGFLALERCLARPRAGNLVALALCTGALLYSQYWSLYLVGAVGLFLAWRAFAGAGAGRRPARFALGAVVVGALSFVPWLPTFAYQSAHTGTPWAAPPNFGAVVNAVTGFTFNQAQLSGIASNQGRLLSVLYFSLLALALFGVARDRFHVDLDLRTRPRARPLAFVVGATLFVAIGGGIVSSSAFSPRYASVVFVPLVVLVAVGSLSLASPKIRAGVLAVAAAAGLAVAVPQVFTQRTQAPRVAAVVSARARPGDVVSICPDQLGPAVDRLLPQHRYRLLTFPRGTSPAFVDWVDYKAVATHTKVAPYVARVEALARGHTIWIVTADGYQGFDDKCALIAQELLQEPGTTARAWVSQSPTRYYEPMALLEVKPAR